MMRPSVPTAALLTLLLGIAACASHPDPDHMVVDETRFSIQVARADHPPIYVQATSESRPVAWLRVLHDGQRVHVEEQCAVPDCDNPGAVCGANIPTVREIAPEGGAGSIDYTWDGTWSVMEEAPRCERREPAPPGEYVARLCYGYAAEFSGDAQRPAGAMGRVTDPVCIDLPFQFGLDAEVVLRIP
jgi:hypothetical protein